MPTYDEAVTHTLSFTQAPSKNFVLNIDLLHFIQYGQVPVGDLDTVENSYGTLFKANRYFDSRLRNGPWLEATNAYKIDAMREATRLIDRLNYKGTKTSPEQYKQFPRSGDLVIPLDIEIACYEIAIMLLDEVDPEMERRNLEAVDRNYSTVKASYDRRTVPDYQLAGIPSFMAWSHLLPYLMIPDITLCRV